MNNPFLIGMIVPPILLLIMEPLAWQYPRYIRAELVLAFYFLIVLLLLGLTAALAVAIITSIVFLLLLEPILWRLLFFLRTPATLFISNPNDLPQLNIGQVKTYTMVIPRLLYWSYSKKGWKGDFFYWHFHYRARLWQTVVGTKPITLAEIDEQTLIGQRITAFSDHYGSYGMGGPGFFGITLSDQPRDDKILVYAVWGADNYMLFDGRVVRTYFIPPKGMESEKDTFASLLIGCQITDIQLAEDRCVVQLIQDIQHHTLEFVKNDKHLIPMPDHALQPTNTLISEGLQHHVGSPISIPEEMPRKNAFETGAISDYLVFKNEFGVLWV